MLIFMRLLPGIGLAACLAAPGLYGQATRTCVSGVGDDANPCSRTAPCKTFAGAISKTAAAGEIEASDGVLRGLTFEGVGTGIDAILVNTARTVIIENCFISGFNHRAINVQTTTSSGFPTKVFISNTSVQNNTNNGVVVAPAAGAHAEVSMDHVNIVSNANFGLSIAAGSNVVVRNSTISHNATGTSFSNVRVDGGAGSAVLDLDKDVIAAAPTGIISMNGATVRVNDSSIVNNTSAISASAGGIVQSYGNNRVTNGGFTATTGLQ